ncbi:MAG: type III-B CRISPR module RAMP protein Cmr6 [Saprospiraceae bacterium]
MPLSYVNLADTSLSDKDCEYEMVQGKITRIVIEGKDILAPASVPQQPRMGENIGQRGGNQGQPLAADSFNVTETFLPKYLKTLPIRDIDNFSLKLFKAARFIPDHKFGKFYFYKNDYRRKKDGSESGHKFEIRPNFGDERKFAAIKNRQEKLTEALCPQFRKTITLHPDWRMVIGLGGGGASVYETGMTLHHVYGFPYLPASSIKGTLRSWIIGEIFSISEETGKIDLKNAEKRALKNKLFVYIFGSDDNSYDKKHQRGHFTFFDAYPVAPPVLEVDIMNVHYPDWYNQKTPPTDFQNPNPIPFLTVARNTRFYTCIGAKENPELSQWPDSEKWVSKLGSGNMTRLLELVQGWLENALTNHGIGAKTAVGYGYMQVTS